MSYLKNPQVQSSAVNGKDCPDEGIGTVVQRRPNMSEGEEEAKVSQVESAVIRLSSLTSTLHSCLDSLEQRLRPALTVLPGNEAAAKGLSPASVPLAGDLLDIGDRLESAIRQIRSMEERVEL